MDQHLAVIQQLIDQAIKAGIVGNLQTAVAVGVAWDEIKKAVVNGSANNNNNS